MRTSEATKEILPALLEVQSNVGNVQKNAANPAFRSQYVTLDAVLAMLRPALTSAGVVILQDPAVDGHTVTLTTRLAHATSGEWLESTCSATAGLDKRGNVGIQQIGSTITYLRRYALMALFAIAPTDDDGNAAQGDDEGYARREHKAAMERTAAVLMERHLLAEAEVYIGKAITEAAPEDLAVLRRWFREQIAGGGDHA